MKRKNTTENTDKRSEVEKLGDYIRNIEYEVNAQVNGTKELALGNLDLYLEPGGNL